jgi:hypothetical protein
MSGQQGSTLQSYNNELVKCLEDLREKREALNKAVCVLLLGFFLAHDLWL